MRGRMVVVVWVLHARQVEHEVAGHHVGLELGLRAARAPPSPLVGDESLATVARLRARAVARRVAR